MKREIRIVIATLLSLAALDAVSQIKVRDVQIVSPNNQPYQIYVVVDSDTWIEHDLTYLEYDWGWQYNESININLKPQHSLRTAFVTCSDTTYLSFEPTENKSVMKGGEFVLDGGEMIVKGN